MLDNLTNTFKLLTQAELVTEYYSAPQFSLCRVADWSIMAIMSKGDYKYDSEGECIESAKYYAWHIDADFGQKLIKNPNLFAATMLSKQTSREPDLIIDSTNCVEALSLIRDEVKNGTRPCIISDELEDILKGVYMSDVEPYIELYGNPPIFTDKKVWLIWLSFFLYPFGLPWFLAGKRKWGMSILLSLIIGCVFAVLFLPLAIPFLAFVVINVFVFYFKLLFGMITDENGKPVITKANQRAIAKKIETYNEYQRDLQEE